MVKTTHLIRKVTGRKELYNKGVAFQVKCGKVKGYSMKKSMGREKEKEMKHNIRLSVRKLKDETKYNTSRKIAASGNTRIKAMKMSILKAENIKPSEGRNGKNFIITTGESEVQAQTTGDFYR
ncbi:hypothetical protein [Fidelibacter multiformis]|uniref:hypothetical protein n=1 Tax=Fidelibacter multiformis TaxID=3377529 RepID=UPI0037DD4926